VRQRVVVTGMGGLCPLGQSWGEVGQKLRAGVSGVSALPEWEKYAGLRTRLAAPVLGFEVPAHYTRKKVRTMGRVSLLATRATELALEDAGLLGSPEVTSGAMGIAYGSTTGSPPAMEVYARMFHREHTVKGIAATVYPQFMSHTCAANLGLFFGIRGRVVPTCSACTAGSQGIGYGCEAIRYGRQTLMVAGGAEELHPINAAVFDIVFATSLRNDAPEATPRPFDVARDGLVVGEGAGTLILEELEHARARGARIHAEVVGFGTNCDGSHMTNPDADGMQAAMELALADAGLDAEDIGYVNAHATGTELGDIAESLATWRVFGDAVPVSSFKGHMGHTLGACGALEAWMAIHMVREGWLAPTLNLERPDPRCADLDYVQGGTRAEALEHFMSNNFAFGGVNTSLIFRRWSERP
jgi:3-oxoacyl-[acyl-carrier-protein] synthase II